MRRKLLLILALAVLIAGRCCGTALADQGGSCGDNVTWTLNSTTHKLTISGTGAMTDYTRGAAPWYADRDSIRSVLVEDGVTGLGNYSFYGLSNMTSATIPDSVTRINNCAFFGCTGLTGVTIPCSVTRIDYRAFTDCTSLTSVTIRNPDCEIGDVGYDVFNGCAAGFTLRGYSGSTAEAYAGNARNPCGFALLAPAPDFFLPAALKTIEADAFRGVKAKAVVIPKSIRSIPGNPFADSDVRCIYGFPGTAAETLTENNPEWFVYFVPLTDAWYARLTN